MITLLLTVRTPGVTSAATPAAFFSAWELTIPQSSTFPSWTMTLSSQGLVHPCPFNCASTLARMVASSAEGPAGASVGAVASAWRRLARLTIPTTFPSCTIDTFDTILFQEGCDLTDSRIRFGGDNMTGHDVRNLARMRPHVFSGQPLVGRQCLKPPGIAPLRARLSAPHEVSLADNPQKFATLANDWDGTDSVLEHDIGNVPNRGIRADRDNIRDHDVRGLHVEAPWCVGRYFTRVCRLSIDLRQSLFRWLC